MTNSTHPPGWCLQCEGERWVCEEHADQPWREVGGCVLCGGAGVPCPSCNKGSPPDMPPGFTVIAEVDRGGMH